MSKHSRASGPYFSLNFLLNLSAGLMLNLLRQCVTVVVPTLSSRAICASVRVSISTFSRINCSICALSIFIVTLGGSLSCSPLRKAVIITLLFGHNCQALLIAFLSFFISITSLIDLNILYSAHTDNVHQRAGFSLHVPLSHAGPVPLLGRLLTDS